MGSIEEAVRDCLARAVAVLPPPPHDRGGTAIGRARRSHRRHSVLAAVALVLGTVVAGGSAVLVHAGGALQSSAGPSPSATPSPSPEAPQVAVEPVPEVYRSGRWTRIAV